jgi:hypothetical protein
VHDVVDASQRRPVQPGTRHPRSRRRTIRFVRSGTTRLARPTPNGTLSRSHTGCTAPSQPR